MTLWRLRHKLKSYVTFGQVFGLISSYFIGWLRVVLDDKSLQGYPVNTGVPEVLCSVLNFSLYTSMAFRLCYL